MVSLILGWAGKGQGASARAAAADGPIPGLRLHVGGLGSSDPAGDNRVEWIEGGELRIGDHVQIRFVPADVADAPARSGPSKPASRRLGDAKVIQCSFCQIMRQTEPKPIVWSGVAGASVFIYVRCIVAAERLLDERLSHLLDLSRTDQRCSFCGTEYTKETVAAAGAATCDGCVDMIMK